MLSIPCSWDKQLATCQTRFFSPFHTMKYGYEQWGLWAAVNKYHSSPPPLIHQNHNRADLLATADINPKPLRQCGGMTGHNVVVGANADTGPNKERC
ncbi:hypothetical protein PBY51_010658 [Eleginops maclovinus]|uniref:Uncharacterized protein n=1 Tax=Eleginops maclovinus TaxID=56733 RepID=A0AAN7XD30_ELEMC|nr:hypothetical protein PBY51_010658 [Eleginops maclovinus]